MKTRMMLLCVFFFMLAGAVSACSSPEALPEPTAVPTAETEIIPVIDVQPTDVPEPTAVPEPTVDPAQAIVLEMIDRVNAKDYAGAAELVADDMMSYFIGMPPTGMEIYRGKAQFQTFLEECCTGQNFEWHVTPWRVEGGTVYAESQTWMDFTRSLGVAPNDFHEIFVVEDGKITLYVSMMTEEALAEFRPALAEVMPELFEVVLPEGETPVNEVSVTIADGTCAYDGPRTLQAGDVTVNVDVQDQIWDKYAVSFFIVDKEHDLIDLMAGTYRDYPPPWSRGVLLKELGPNEKETYKSLNVHEGSYYYLVCWGGSPDIPIGNAGPFIVAPAVDPAEAVVLEMIDRVNAEDYAGAAELVADDMMSYFIGMPPTGMEIYRGKAQFQTFLEECCTGQNFEWQVTPKRVQDGKVTAESQTWMDFTRELGVAPNDFHETFVVEDGKITLYVSIMTEEALAEFRPALAEVIPELFAVALPEGETPVDEVTVTFADGTCTYDGPMTLQAGDITLNLAAEDKDKDKYGVGFFTLDEGKDLIDLMASTYNPNPAPWSKLIFLAQVNPNESKTFDSLTVEEGLVYMICLSKPPDIPVGNAGPFVVQK